jgi:HlyD family secretion protein
MQRIGLINKKYLLVGAAILAMFLVYLIARGCSGTKTLVYEYETVGYGDIQKTVTASGTLHVQGVNRVLSKISGVVSKVNVRANQEISAGQVLVVIDSSNIDQNLERAKNRLDSSYIDLQKAQRDLETKKAMHEENLISKQSLENEEFLYKSTLLKYRQAKFEYDLALQEKRSTSIKSPISGVVLEINTGINLPVNVNQELVKVAPSLKKMVLLIDVDESDIGNIQKEQPVQFSVSAYPDQIFKGKITFIDINPKSKGPVVTYQTHALCDNENFKLKPGMTASATVIVQNKKNVLRVLNQAFIVSPVDMAYNEKAKYVWKKTKNIVGELPVERIEVETGIVGNMHTEVTKNLKKGDKVLIKISQGKSR